MSTDQTPIQLRRSKGRPPADVDIADSDLLQFALGFADHRAGAPTVAKLLAEFGDVDVILASEPDDLRGRGGLSNRAVAVLKLLHAFRRDSRRATLLH